jgi:hypothetical protein
MTNIRIPRSVCAAIGEVLVGSHATLDALFESSGAPGEPPGLAHHSKWKEWLFRAGNDPEVDSLAVLGNVLEEFMDLHPQEDSEEYEEWTTNRNRIVNVLEEHGFQYFRGGRVLPNDISVISSEVEQSISTTASVSKPSSVEDLLMILVRGLPRAMHPLTHRRKDAQPLSFSSEYDVQDLLHALLRPWVADIRPEEFTPSYAGSSTRMDFLLPTHSLVIELKFVRDKNHGKRIGDELIIDIEHYRRHPDCKFLWCVIYDPEKLLLNAEGLKTDLDGRRNTPDGTVTVNVMVL